MRIISDSLGVSSAPISILDPSELYRPDVKEGVLPQKAADQFRIYNGDQNDPIQKRVLNTYLNMHTYQNYQFVQDRLNVWTAFNHIQLPILDALDKLNELVDESDPDVDVPNIYHAYQTAEMIRKVHPDKPWFQLTGLIHDLGKLMALYGEAQWAVVGDTFPVGCDWGNSIVYRSNTFYNNTDTYDSRYNTKYGIYSEHCGLDKVQMSWGHDEYMYRVLVNHGSTLPEEGLYMIRYHSFYPWHTGGDYSHLCSNKDTSMLEWVREFNKFDLYTKADVLPEIDDLKPYYQKLVDEFIPGVVNW